MKLFYLFCILLSPLESLADSAILEVVTHLHPNFIWVRFRGPVELSMFVKTIQGMTPIKVLDQKNTLEFFVLDNKRRNFIMRAFQAFDPTVPCPIIGEDSDAVMGILVQ